MIIALIIAVLISLAAGYFLRYVMETVDTASWEEEIDIRREINSKLIDYQIKQEIVLRYLLGRAVAKHEVEEWANTINARELYSKNKSALANLQGLHELEQGGK